MTRKRAVNPGTGRQATARTNTKKAITAKRYGLSSNKKMALAISKEFAADSIKQPDTFPTIIKPKTGKRTIKRAISPVTKQPIKLTEKQKAFADYKLDNPKANNTQAAMMAYNASNRHVAQQIGSENMSKPVILAYLGKHSEEAEAQVVRTMQAAGKGSTASWQRLALDSANSILDRVHGKATQRTETLNKTIEVKLDLSGLRIGTHYLEQIVAHDNAPSGE